MKSKAYIEVNGKRYDASTGKLLSSSEIKPDVKTSPVSIDGVRRVKPTQDKVHTLAAHKKPRPAQRSQTLIRQAVKKPAAKQAPVKVDTKQPVAAKSPLITKFGTNLGTKVEPRIEPVMMAHKPVKITKPATASQAVTNSVTKPAHSSPTSESLIAKALSTADAHKLTRSPQKKLRKHRVARKLGITPKAARFGSIGLATLLLGLFFAYQNVPNFAMRVASARAGFAANMPGYVPSGFGMNGPVQYKSGEVTVSFGSRSGDGRNFSVIQRSSNWNNDALLANFVSQDNREYQTFQSRDNTIYIYGGSNATWVKNGVWYQIEGDSRLTTDQLSHIAESI